MDLTRNGPIELAEQRLRWLDRRQEVLARNIANADTPGYRPSDIAPFAKMLSQQGEPSLARTDARHLTPSGGSGAMRARTERRSPEQSPNGNAVALDEQALKVADNETAHQLASGLRRQYINLYRTALGRNG